MFDEEFELQAFPFDNQDCTVSVLLHTRAFRLTYRRNPTRESTFEESKVMLTEVCSRPLASGQPAETALQSQVLGLLTAGGRGAVGHATAGGRAD